MSKRDLLAMAFSTALATAGSAEAEPVLELRQYKLVEGKRDAMVALFDREFVETQEAVGMRLVGQFRDLDDPSRFIWIREFPDMAQRARALTAFYSGPVWKAHRDEANPLMVHSDNVFLLRAAPGRGFAPNPPRDGRAAGLVVAHVWRLWAEPDATFAEAFEEQVRPGLEAAGLPLLAAYLPERAANNFPALPVREGERVFVWFTRAASADAYAAAAAKLQAQPQWRAFLAEHLEGPPRVLRLAPTPRSALR